MTLQRRDLVVGAGALGAAWASVRVLEGDTRRRSVADG